MPPRVWRLSPWPYRALTGLYSGSHSGMLRLLISEAIFFLWPGLVTPMAVRSWGREGGQCRPAPAVPPAHRARPHLRRHPADGGDVVAGVDEVGSVELQLELAEPLVHGLRALGRGDRWMRAALGMGTRHSCPCPPSCPHHTLPAAPSAPRSPSPLMEAPFSSAGARRGAGGRRGSWPRSATATNLPEGQRSARPGPGPAEGRESPALPWAGATAPAPGWQGRGRHRRAHRTPSPAEPPGAPTVPWTGCCSSGRGRRAAAPSTAPSSGTQPDLSPRASVPGAQAAARGVPVPKTLWRHSSGLATRQAGSQELFIPWAPPRYLLVPSLQGKEGCPEIFPSCF